MHPAANLTASAFRIENPDSAQELVGAAQFVEGVRGKALKTQARVYYGVLDASPLPNEGTLQFWFRLDIDGQRAEAVGPLEKSAATVVSTGPWTVDIRNLGEVPAFYSLAERGRYSHFNYYVRDKDNPLVPGTWVHVAQMWKGQTASLYVDGILAREQNLPRETYDWHKELGIIEIGNYNLFGSSYWVIVDELRIYDYARSPEQIARDARR
jgi:hypothetical protein